MAFLQHAAKRCDLVIDNQVSCALKMARRGFPELQSYRLTELAKPWGYWTKTRIVPSATPLVIYCAAVSQLGTAN